jgi:hypothetical protein
LRELLFKTLLNIYFCVFLLKWIWNKS